MWNVIVCTICQFIHSHRKILLQIRFHRQGFPFFPSPLKPDFSSVWRETLTVSAVRCAVEEGPLPPVCGTFLNRAHLGFRLCIINYSNKYNGRNI